MNQVIVNVNIVCRQWPGKC